MTAATGVLLPGFAGTELPAWLARRLEGGLAGVCLFGLNISSPEQLRRLTAHILAANPAALIAIDEEGGDVTRLHAATGSPYPGNALLGRIDDVGYTEQVARTVGEELRLAGCNLDFAPDSDVNSNPRNPVIGVRSFGADPALVARHTAAWVRGLQSSGTSSTSRATATPPKTRTARSRSSTRTSHPFARASWCPSPRRSRRASEPS
jgi:beta-N-acetylhexosaminidase